MKIKRRTYVLWKKILTRLSIILAVIVLFYIYFGTGLLTIDTYVIKGAPDVYVGSLDAGMRNLADQKIYKVLPGNRIISYHNSDIRALIMDTLPNTSHISMRPTGLHTLTVELQSYVPLFSISDTYAIARDGTIYKEIAPLADYPRLTIASSTQVSPDMLSTISTFADNITSVLFPVKFIQIDEYSDIRFYSGDMRTSVAIASGNDPKKTWSNILSAIDTDPLKKQLDAKVQQLEYLDARFGNKVFYKFTNGAVPAIIPPHDQATTITASTTSR